MATFTLLALVLLAGTACCSPKVSRISGGEEIDIDYLPFIVQVEFQGPDSGIWAQSCAGSILTSSFILSCASCFSGVYYDRYLRRIRAGTEERNSGGQVRHVYYNYNHPDFGQNDMDSDITVVHLAAPLEYTPQVQQGPILPQDYIVPDNYPVNIAGWGSTEAGGPSSLLLLQASVNILNNKQCTETYAEINRTITTNMICTGGCRCKSCCDGDTGACLGDAGGPVFIDNVVVGLISWAQGCGKGSYPTVSTSVAKFSNWIVNVAQ